MYTWLTIFIILLVVELATADLVTIWFVAGSIAAFITSFFTDNVGLEIAIFLIVSILTLIVARPFIKKFKPKEIKTNYDRVLGKEGTITKKVTKDSYGEVKVLGQTWTCKSEETLEEDTKVEVLSIDGVKLIVKKKES